MEELAKFLPKAHWKEDRQSLFYCNDPELGKKLVDVVKELPEYIRGYSFTVWKILGTTTILEPNGYIIHVPVNDSGHLLDTQLPIEFEREVTLTPPALYFIVALPQSVI